MLHAVILCAVFTSMSIPADWHATEVKTLDGRATIRLTRQYKPKDRIQVPDGCFLVDESSGLVIQQPVPPGKVTVPPYWGTPNLIPHGHMPRTGDSTLVP